MKAFKSIIHNGGAMMSMLSSRHSITTEREGGKGSTILCTRLDYMYFTVYFESYKVTYLFVVPHAAFWSPTQSWCLR